ncbi:MAG: YnfA family protein [Cytophagaceae bacterium]
MNILISALYFIAAALCEIGGVYLIWNWLREGGSIWRGLAGLGILVLYGFIQTLQPGSFEKVYASYGGVFIVLSILWGWKIDGIAPDRFDLIGCAVVLAGVGIIMYWPR